MSLEPYPDALLGDTVVETGPDARYGAADAIGLAFVAALQGLPPGWRAALVLRDVLGFGAAEVADMLDISEASVEVAVRAARARMPSRDGGRPPPPPAHSPAERRLVRRFAAAFEAADAAALAGLLTEDASFAIPSGRFRLVATRANAQPAFGLYRLDPGATIARGRGIMALTLAGDRIAAVTVFRDARLLAYFGLPETLSRPEACSRPTAWPPRRPPPE